MGNKRIYGVTLLFIAAKTGCKELVNTLIAAGANVNKTCYEGITPRYVAKSNEVRNILSKAGALSTVGTCNLNTCAYKYENICSFDQRGLKSGKVSITSLKS